MLEELAARKLERERDALRERIRGLRVELDDITPLVTASLEKKSQGARPKEGKAKKSSKRRESRDEAEVPPLVRTVYQDKKGRVSEKNAYSHIIRTSKSNDKSNKLNKLPVRRDVSKSYLSDGNINSRSQNSR